jgi:hypothetical protein
MRRGGTTAPLPILERIVFFSSVIVLTTNHYCRAHSEGKRSSDGTIATAHMRALGAEPIASGAQHSTIASLAGALLGRALEDAAPVQETAAVGPTLLQCLLEIAALGVLTVVSLQVRYYAVALKFCLITCA